MIHASIGIPFKNPGRHFEAALKSVLAQTFEDWELILVDDGSKDGSLELARRIEDPRVRVVSDGLTRGLACRLNQIAREAAAPYCFRMDADDLMHPERMEKQMALLKREGHNAVTGTGAYVVDAENNPSGMKAASGPIKGFAIRHAFIHPTVAAATEWFRKNPYDEDSRFHRAEDAELWCRTAATSRFVHLEEPLLFYRESSSLSFSNYAATATALFNILHAHYISPLGRYAYLLAREMGKLGLFMAMERLGRADHLLPYRNRSLSRDELDRARQLLASLQARELPLASEII